jgi:hypothetical protein
MRDGIPHVNSIDREFVSATAIERLWQSLSQGPYCDQNYLPNFILNNLCDGRNNISRRVIPIKSQTKYISSKIELLSVYFLVQARWAFICIDSKGYPCCLLFDFSWFSSPRLDHGGLGSVLRWVGSNGSKWGCFEKPRITQFDYISWWHLCKSS